MTYSFLHQFIASVPSYFPYSLLENLFLSKGWNQSCTLEAAFSLFCLWSLAQLSFQLYLWFRKKWFGSLDKGELKYKLSRERWVLSKGPSSLETLGLSILGGWFYLKSQDYGVSILAFRTFWGLWFVTFNAESIILKIALILWFEIHLHYLFFLVTSTAKVMLHNWLLLLVHGGL